VRPPFLPLALGSTLLALGAVLPGQEAPAAPPLRAMTAIAAAGDAVDAWEGRVRSMTRAGTLRLVSSVEDTMLEGRVHDRFDQYAGAARIFGAQVVRQRSASATLSVFGTLHPDDLRIDTTPTLPAESMVARLRAIAGDVVLAGGSPELVVLPLDDGTYRLTWLVHAASAGDVVALFVDASTGEEVRRFSVLQTQSAVGVGTGVLGDRMKLSTRQAAGVFFADEALRPAPLVTYDLRGNSDRAMFVMNLLGGVKFTQADIATDADNMWTDGAVVDAHAGIATTYDYYFARFNRRGFDGTNSRPTRVIVHPAPRGDIGALPTWVVERFVLNAFWCAVCGGDNGGVLVFGEGMDRPSNAGGQYVNYYSAGLDVVAHEFSHAVTSYSANLIYDRESGALNESFSDIMSIGVEYYAAATGRRTRPGNYQLGEDVYTGSLPGVPDGLRSASRPVQFGHPDHYSSRYVGVFDDGGVHINSSISNHAYYLAIEGGHHIISGVTVQGVGAANRAQIERVFYRGFTSYLTPSATFAQARQATVRAAIDLYGESSPAFRAVSEAWTAVGVN
jgi:Zn-dependent metalloprotease